MPISLHARWMRRAISPRLAIRTFLNMQGAGSLNDEQRLPEFDGLSVLAEDLAHRASLVGLDLVHDLHRLDDADRLAFLDHRADFREGFRPGARRPVEGAYHRRFDDVTGVRRRF